VGSCLRNRKGLGMWLAGTFMPAGADDFAGLHEHTSDTGIGRGGVHAERRQGKCLAHEVFVL
jgi:hypothetical protein